MSNWSNSHSQFVTDNDDIYVDSGASNQIAKVSFSPLGETQALRVAGTCRGLFVDANHDLYCSLYDFHKVVKRSL